MPAFKFESLADFLYMSGHGIYVWSCTAIAVVLLGGLILHPLWLQKRQFKKMRSQQALIDAQAIKHQQVNNNT
ncbi:heme exporter protein CcmD [Gilvimarinus sp. SDUM040013]|uniref:Heme exporter protein D n=1 Tax=Gilvimarinus gilvus TaxID=3058038 RepID=A0ABU4S1V9_9GAMM|nr:heme exporter protein CcmD [Gilvimarinus sp. SDUM040013]MDO3385579.1 heme exporter protein CcmD [Gilvimarinus sp. SDUM040013]MDX6851170.1 heme exporter protein CcmD [Gilvimarinus sp. SDUM040013]